MSISVTLYNTDSDKRVKSKTLTSVKSLTCEFYDNSSIINPKILVAYDADVFLANYMYIPTFHRYYYINDITVLNGRQILIDGHTDVLMSFNLDNVVGIVDRQASEWNAYLPDDKLQMFGYTRTQTIAFTPTDPFIANNELVLTVVGEHATT